MTAAAARRGEQACGAGNWWRSWGGEAEAREFYERFVAAFPRDARTFLARRLAAGGEVVP